MDNQKLLKQIRKLVEDAQYNLLNNICNHLGINDTKKNELKALFIEGMTSHGDNSTSNDIQTGRGKRATPRKPSQYNEFVKIKMAELRAGGAIPPSQALQVVAKAWKEKEHNKLTTPTIQLGSGHSNVINITDTPIDLTPKISNINNSIPSTPLLNDNEQTISDEAIIEKPQSLTRIRFFGTTYLWDKINNNVYSDDISSTNDNFTIIGTMQLSETSQPTKIIFS